MLSGVGPAPHLKEHGIEIVRDIPAVGQHLIDHPIVDVYLRDKFRTSHKFLKPRNITEVVQLIGSAVQYLVYRTGALASNVSRSYTSSLLRTQH